MTSQPEHETKVPAHEPLSVSVRAIGISAVALAALIGLTMWAMGGLSPLLSPGESAEEVESFVKLSVETPQTTVGLNPNQAVDRLELDLRQREWLTEYAWVDPQQETARIPIERAIEIVQERGVNVELDGGAASASGAPSENGGQAQ